MSDERAKAALTSIKQSVGGRQPIKAGGGGGDREAGRISFERWADRRLDPDKRGLIKRVDKTYRQAAQALDLMRPDQVVPEINIERAMARIKMMAQ